LALDFFFRFVLFRFKKYFVLFRFWKNLFSFLYRLSFLLFTRKNQKRWKIKKFTWLAFKKTMSDSKVPPILARSGSKMNFKIEKSRSTLTRVAGVVNKMFAFWLNWVNGDIDQNFQNESSGNHSWFSLYRVNWLINMFRFNFGSDLSSFEARYASISLNTIIGTMQAPKFPGYS
jgi:hypothetical protein